MALPTLKPYYVTRACSRGGGGPDSARVRRMAERRMQDEERYQQWSENNRYFKTTEVNSQKQREWTSDTCFEDRWVYMYIYMIHVHIMLKYM